MSQSEDMHESHHGGRSRSHTIAYPPLASHPNPPDAAPLRSPNSSYLTTAFSNLLIGSPTFKTVPLSPSPSLTSSSGINEPITPPALTLSRETSTVEEDDIITPHGYKPRSPIPQNKGVLGSRRSSWAQPGGSDLSVLNWLGANKTAPADDGGGLGLLRRFSLSQGSYTRVSFILDLLLLLEVSNVNSQPNLNVPSKVEVKDESALSVEDEDSNRGRSFIRRPSNSKRKLSPMYVYEFQIYFYESRD